MDSPRVKYSTEVTLDQVEKVAPTGYRRAMNGENKKPGRYGEGIGGEPLVVLLPDDDGAWFDSLVAGQSRTQ
jgi:hypothetical protein